MTLKRAVQDDAKTELGRLSRLGHIFNMNLDVGGNRVSYYRTKSGIDNWESYTNRFLDTYERRDYACVMTDGSLIQLHYEFSNNLESLNEGSLAYYPNPGFAYDDVGDLARLTGEDRNEMASLALQVNENFLYGSNYLRIDYQPSDKHYRELLHPCTHIHIGASNSLRLAATRFPLFSEFMDFILYAYYPQVWVGLSFGDESLIDGEKQIDFQGFLAKRRETARKNQIENRLSDCEREYYLLSL